MVQSGHQLANRRQYVRTGSSASISSAERVWSLWCTAAVGSRPDPLPAVHCRPYSTDTQSRSLPIYVLRRHTNLWPSASLELQLRASFLTFFNFRVSKEIGVAEHDGDVRFQIGSGNMAVLCMRNASGHNYRNSSFTVDAAMRQIPRSTERISNLLLKFT